jgi:hypothetical protein
VKPEVADVADIRELMLMEWPAAASSRCRSYTERLRLRHGHSQIPNAVAKGSGLQAALRLTEEESAFFGVVAELVTEDPKNVSRIGVHQKVGSGESRGFSSKSRIPPTEHLLQSLLRTFVLVCNSRWVPRSVHASPAMIWVPANASGKG